MKKIIVVALLLLVGGIGTAVYMWNKPHRDVAGEKAAYQLEAKQLFSSYQENETEANAKYLDKVIQVKGELLDKATENGVLFILKTDDEMFGVSCAIDSSLAINPNDFAQGQEITLKGKCDGFNGFEVVLTQCTIEK